MIRLISASAKQNVLDMEVSETINADGSVTLAEQEEDDKLEEETNL
jgi:hypothetical protein